jgi:hypothetical protein
MANLYDSLTQSASQPNPSEQWVYASDQYAIYEITPSAVPDTRAKWDRVGHTIMNSINPDYVMMRSADGVILMVVGNSRWDAASLKQTMDRECFQAAAADVTYTVTAGTGYFAGRRNDANDGITIGGNTQTLTLNPTFTHWRNFADVFVDDGGPGPWYMEISRTQATLPGGTEATWNDETGEKDLIAEADKAIGYNLGNYFTGRYNEFPLDLAITNGSNLRMYHMDVDEIDNGDGTGSTTSVTSGVTTQPGATTGNIYDRDGYMSVLLGSINPLMYTWQRYHDIADGDDGSSHTNRLVWFQEQDKYGAGSGYALATNHNWAGGDLENDGNTDNDAGMIVAPIAFTQTP